MSVPDERRPGLARRRRALAARTELRPRVAALAESALEADLAADLLARFDRRFLDVFAAVERVYGATHDVIELLTGELHRVVRAAAARPAALRRRDRDREIGPDWYLSEQMIGYVAYADRFAGDLPGVVDHLDYLTSLGVTYLHLMPLLEPRPAPNDGGYAVMDYRRVDPKLGTMADLQQLADRCHDRGMNLCIDLVVNHTAREHEWAARARRGEPAYRDYYRLFDDRTLPDRYEQTLWEVFPHLAPGNFTWDAELDAWVWTSFNDYQWDLNYENPAVFGEMFDIILELANRGVDVLRLDAVPFLWKRLGTNCQNLPEAHAILQAWRGLLAMAAPATIFKAEAIVGHDELIKYLGVHDRHRPECELAYHNQLMVQGWSALAARDARLMTASLERMPPPPPTATWVTYVRCHDDIGWAVMDEDAAAVGWNGPAHRDFLNRFYAGEFPGSFARGERFGENPETGDARISGSAASLCGLEEALDRDDPAAVDRALRRLRLLYAFAMSWGGIPLIWMGDELALRNDHAYLDDPARAADNRWLQRPAMDWRAVEQTLADPASVGARAFDGLRHLVEVRRSLPMLHAGGRSVPVRTDDGRVFAHQRRHPAQGHLLSLANVSEEPASVDAAHVLGVSELTAPSDALADDGDPGLTDGRIHLAPLQVRWLVDDV